MRDRSVLSRRSPWRPVDPAKGPWLIWSHHWNCWHVRNSEGGASGYTSDVLKAGLFDYTKAKEYHDTPPHRRDEAVPIARFAKLIAAHIRRKQAELASEAAQLEALLARVSASLPNQKETGL